MSYIIETKKDSFGKWVAEVVSEGVVCASSSNVDKDKAIAAVEKFADMML